MKENKKTLSKIATTGNFTTENTDEQKDLTLTLIMRYNSRYDQQQTLNEVCAVKDHIRDHLSNSREGDYLSKPPKFVQYNEWTVPNEEDPISSHDIIMCLVFEFDDIMTQQSLKLYCEGLCYKYNVEYQILNNKKIDVLDIKKLKMFKNTSMKKIFVSVYYDVDAIKKSNITIDDFIEYSTSTINKQEDLLNKIRHTLISQIGYFEEVNIPDYVKEIDDKMIHELINRIRPVSHHMIYFNSNINASRAADIIRLYAIDNDVKIDVRMVSDHEYCYIDKGK